MKWILGPSILTLLLAACAGAAPPPGATSGEDDSGLDQSSPISPTAQAPTDEPAIPVGDEREPSSSEPLNPIRINKRVDDPNTYRIPRMLPLDGIAPVYDPQFVNAQEAPLLDDELVIGIQHQGEAKAYPITGLRFREMVNDEIGDWPVLVTW